MKKSFLHTALTVFLSVAAVNTALAQGITPDHIATMNTVTGCTISNDGTYVAYTLSTPTDPFKENKKNSTHLYVLNTETGKSSPYVTTSGVSQIKFRPEKETITFLSKRSDDEHTSIYEISLDGGEATKVFSHKNNIVKYDWHSDGNQLVFITSSPGEKPESPLEYKPDFYEESFSSRTAYIAQVNQKNNEAKALNVSGEVYHAVWSPDGSKIAVAAAPTSAVDDMYMKQKISIVNSATQNVSASVDNEGKLGQIVWSPDSKQLALRAAKDINDPIDGRILTVSANGGKPQLIDGNFEGKYEHISWNKDNRIHFLASQGTGSVLGSLEADGSKKQTRLETTAHAISNFSEADKGMIAFTASTPQHPTEIYTLDKGRNAKPEKQTKHNDWLEDVRLGKQEVVRYTTRDGDYELEGMLIYPTDYKEGSSVPLITVVHGGPEAHYSNGWLTAYSMPGQMAAAKGYAVFYPNYRGSTGRGAAFAYSSQGDLAGKEFDDIVDGVDYLIERGIADKDRIGVTGGSYGGYASAWMSTYYSDRFAAAVMFVGISNNLSKWGTSDIPEELYHVHSRKRIWDHWQWNLERSPVYHVDKAQTPILIMHGANDPRVHPAQSMELYRHLKVRKPEVPVRLIYYPKEGHGNTYSGSKYDYNLRMLQWFDTYLKTGNRTAEKPSLDLPVEKK